MVSGKRILVTGITGMMGRALAEHLAGANEVWGVARFADPALRRRFEARGIHCLPLDLAAGDLASLPRGVDVLLHLAVQWGGPPRAALEFNGLLTGRLLEALPDLEAYVLGSSVAVYTGSGVREELTEESVTVLGGVYGTGKLLGDTVAAYVSRRRGLAGSILRYWFPYTDEPGVPQNYYEGLLSSLRAGSPFRVPVSSPGCQQPLFIADLVRITVDSLRFASPEPFILNVAGHERLSLRQILETMGRASGLEPKIVLDPAGGSDLLSGSYDLTKLARTCGLGTVPFAEGMARLCRRTAAA
jgi:nucleoside-diphosphate-sugar epimerase